MWVPAALPGTAGTAPIGEASSAAQQVLPEERRAAREQGYAEGLRQAQREADEALATQREALTTLLDALQRQQAEVVAAARRRLEAILAALVEAQVLQEVHASPALLDRLVDEAVGIAGLPAEQLTITVGTDFEPLLSTWPARDQFPLHIDESLAPGAVQLKAGHRHAHFDPKDLIARVYANQTSPADQESG